MSEQESVCPDLEPGEIETIEAEDRREEGAVAREARR